MYDQIIDEILKECLIMKILFVSNYFPPEVNAPATRLIEHARQWIKEGHQVEVLTSVPNFPEGRVYDGYKNQFSFDDREGVRVARVPMYVTKNEGTIKRTFSYISFMLSACWYARKLSSKPDIVIATSPQFFCAIGGYFIAKLKRAPFVLEIRDLWPESIVAVGAVERNAIIKIFERIELFLYRKSDHIVVVTNAFKRFIIKKGIAPEKISVIKNGADLTAWSEPLDEDKLANLKEKLGLNGKFVVSYVGTIGMAHRADVLLEAAQQCDDPDITFVVIGSGAERLKLEERAAELNLPNFKLLDRVSKSEVRYIMALTDVSIVHLRASPLFKTVIPSKIFEAMATRTPIVLGVEGESKEIVEEAGAGLTIEPENVDELVEAVKRLKMDPILYAKIQDDGQNHVQSFYDRSVLAKKYLEEVRYVM